MLKMLVKLGIDYRGERAKCIPDPYTRFQFTSKRKRMSTVIQNCGQTEHGHDRRCHMKGAAEIVLDSCNSYLNDQGQKVPLNDSVKQEFLNVITLYAGQSLRTISFAYKDLKPNEGGEKHENIGEGEYLYDIEKGGYTLIAIAGIKDVIREEVPNAVALCHRAGITVRMVTGDNLVTAKAIARECNILNDELLSKPDAVMEGPEFYKRMGGLTTRKNKNGEEIEGILNLEAFKAIKPNLRVLARSRPEDKYLLVTGLRELGEVVGVTGDGTNDAPALKKADVGFAMGITGTEIAKHAAAIIIMDDNFASIIKAIMWGRNIYDNIRKFLQFQISVSLVALMTAFVGAVILKYSPLQPIQLLWVNLIIDSLAALALATEPPNISLLDRPPQGRHEYIISRKMIKQIIAAVVWSISIMYAIAFGGQYFFPEPMEDLRCNDTPYVCPGMPQDYNGNPQYSIYYPEWGASRQMTNVFNAFVVMAIFNIFNARVINDDLNIFKNLFKNWIFCVIVVTIVGLHILIIEVGKDAFKVSRRGLHIYHWLISLMLGLTIWIAGLIARLLPDTWVPQLGKSNEEEEGKGEEHAVKRQGSSIGVKMRGSFRSQSKQGSLRKQASDRAGSQRKQQSSQNMAPHDKEYK